MPSPVILSTAWEDIDEIAERLLQTVGPQSAESTTDAMLDAIALLENMPSMGPLHHDAVLQRLGFRKLLVKCYVCAYRIIDGVPTVYDVFRQSQGYAARLASES